MIVYASITYILWGLTYTIMDIPYWSMVPDLGTTAEERDQISAIPRLFASAAWMLVGGSVVGAVKFFCGESPARGYAWVALIIAVLFIACTAAAIFNVPTTHHANANLHQQKTSLKPMLRVLFLNDHV